MAKKGVTRIIPCHNTTIDNCEDALIAIKAIDDCLLRLKMSFGDAKDLLSWLGRIRQCVGGIQACHQIEDDEQPKTKGGDTR